MIFNFYHNSLFTKNTATISTQKQKLMFEAEAHSIFKN